MSRDAAAAFAEMGEVQPDYETAHDYYSGKVGEVFGSKRLRRLLQRQGKPFKVNVIRGVADAVGDRLELLGVQLEEGGDTTPAGRMLAEVWAKNALDFEAPNVHHRGCEYGDAYVMVWENPDETDPVPVVNYHSPLGMRIFYDPDNPRRKLFAAHLWESKDDAGKKSWRMNLLYPERVEKWQALQGEGGKAERWVEYLTDAEDPDSWFEENPYGEVPVFHFRNATPYGTPRHYDGYGCQDAITKIVVSHMSTMDFHIAPQRYALAEDTETDDDFDVDDEFGVDGEETPGADQSKGVTSGPGSVWWLKNVKSVGQFDAASSEAFTSPLSMYLRLMAQTTKTPLHVIDESSGNEPSGESRRRKDAPLTDAVRTYAKMYATTWAELLAFALKVAGHDDQKVKVTFAPAEVVADSEGWATIKAKIEAGVPVRVALLEAGYSDAEVEAWFPEGEENTLRVADLVSVADILQKLGAAVSLGILSKEEARALLPEGLVDPDALEGLTVEEPVVPAAEELS